MISSFRRFSAPALAALLALSACSRAPRADYRIGCVVSLTGKGESVGRYTRNGIDLAIAELNATTFKDSPIQVFYGDTGSQTERAVALFREMVDQHHVPVVIGLPVSDEVLAIAPEANRRRVVLLSSNGVADDIRTAGDYVFRLRESAALQSEAMARALIERLGKKKIAVLHSSSVNGVSYRDSFVTAAVHLGVPIPQTVAFEDGRSDYRAEIARAAAAAPDAIFLSGLDKEVGLILRQARQQGLSTQFAISAGALTQALIETAGAAAEGVISACGRFDRESKDPQVHAFVTAYEGRYHEPAHRVAGNGYDAVQIVASLFQEGAKDAEGIKRGLYGLRDFPGVGGPTTFDALGEVNKPIALYRIEGGKIRETK